MSSPSNVEIIAVQLPGQNRPSFCRTERMSLTVGDQCIVDIGRGQEMGKIVAPPRIAKERLLKGAPGRIVRKATTEDFAYLQRKIDLEGQARELARRTIRELKLGMKLVAVRFSFDSSKATFLFSAEERMDYRDLVRRLSQELKIRVEMKQIGVRDEARLMGGFGCCGRSLCCATFLQEFRPVSIRMAKEQGLSLIPSKISGICGRLMCCLTYEYESYRDLHKRLPRVGKKVLTPRGLGRLRQLDIQTERAQIELEGGQLIEVDIPPAGSDKRTPEELRAEADRIREQLAAEAEAEREAKKVESRPRPPLRSGVEVPVGAEKPEGSRPDGRSESKRRSGAAKGHSGGGERVRRRSRPGEDRRQKSSDGEASRGSGGRKRRRSRPSGQRPKTGGETSGGGASPGKTQATGSPRPTEGSSRPGESRSGRRRRRRRRKSSGESAQGSNPPA